MTLHDVAERHGIDLGPRTHAGTVQRVNSEEWCEDLYGEGAGGGEREAFKGSRGCLLGTLLLLLLLLSLLSLLSLLLLLECFCSSSVLKTH